MALETALIHRARQVGWQRSATRSDQGEYVQEPLLGPWIPARLMIRGGVASEAKPLADSTLGSVVRNFELLLGAEDEDSNPIEAPTASATFQTDCEVLGSPTVKLSGEPEPLNDGDELFGYMAYADISEDRS